MTAVRRPALSPRHRAFALEYFANGFNASAAYRKTYPRASDATAMVEGSRLLRNPKVQAFLAPRLEAHWKARQMAGDEALARVAMDASADLRRLYDANGQLLPVKDWPSELANSVEAIEFREGALHKVKLVSKGQARRTILEQTGKIKNPLEGVMDALAEAMRQDLEKHTGGS